MSTEQEVAESVNVRLTPKGRDGLVAEAGRLQMKDGKRRSIADALEFVLDELRELREAR